MTATLPCGSACQASLPISIATVPPSRTFNYTRLQPGEQLAHQLRTLVAQHPADYALGLDTMLAIFDPHSFGAARPELITTTSQIDFGLLTPASFTYKTSVTIHNKINRSKASPSALMEISW